MRLFVALSLLLVPVLPLTAVADSDDAVAAEQKVSAADKRAEKKEATLWFKDYMDSKKKAAAALKKVKDAKSAKKAVKTISELYGLSNSGKQTAMGEVGEAKRPEMQALDELMARNEKKIEKLNDAIEAEKARIDEAELLTSELGECIDKASQ